MNSTVPVFNLTTTQNSREKGRFLTVNRSLKTFVVQNPVSGTHDKDQVRQVIDQVMNENGISYQLHETTPEDDVHEIAKKALDEGYKRFLAVGGDGTVGAVASALTNTHIPVIIIPMGTSNAMADILGIPDNLEEAVSWWLAASQTKTLDAMQVGEHYYYLNITVGYSSRTLGQVKRETKRALGELAYWLGGLQHLAGISLYKYRLKIDGKLFIYRASEVIVANSGIIHYDPIRFDPELSMDDGKLSVCRIRVRNVIDFVRVMGNIISGRSQDTPEMSCQVAHREVNIQLGHSLPVQADGEIIGYTPVTVKLCPAAVEFLVPDPQEND